MDIVSYLYNIYGYDTPIFIKDVRIGRKNKTAIREEFYRASKKGLLQKQGKGIYYIKSDKEFGAVITFRDVIEKKYLYSDGYDEFCSGLFIEGYYSGLTFLNIIGVSQQVPAILEITTNKTSSKKYCYELNGRMAYIRKARTKVTPDNWMILQFLDMFYFVSLDEVKENKKLLRNYIKKHGLSKKSFYEYIKLYDSNTLKKIKDGGILDAFIK